MKRKRTQEAEAETTTDSRDWTSLPPELLAKIGEKLPIPHRACFRATCKDWCSASLPVVIPSPWLLFVIKNGDTCAILSLPTRRSFTYSLLPDLRGVQYVGSQAGWLAVYNKNMDASLINPLTAARICLPSFLTLPKFDLVDGRRFSYYFVTKVIFSANPTTHNYIAVTLYGIPRGEIAYAKAGGDKWNLLQTTSTQNRSYEDIMYHDGKFYCMTVDAEVFAFDLSGVSPTVTLVAESMPLDSLLPSQTHSQQVLGVLEHRGAVPGFEARNSLVRIARMEGYHGLEVQSSASASLGSCEDLGE
ncbi:hypothetical protein MUK42_33428 [Musa troglodytarum]|uniref:F-box domain-containing protein n=1 Tax=Musa troglodytarum TaxID=320322 RepID=A0A9E7H4I4_9LILI|nr:hypothetical protein MUK42_33428 [Musa troglodytarum]